jgi:phage baseplate assembly protein W
MNRTDGSTLAEDRHIQQSIADILTTPIGSRIQRREYGSLLPSLIDMPATDAERLRVVAAAVIAIMRWEPRIRLHRVRFGSITREGQANLEITAELRDDNRHLDLTVPLRMGASA